MGTERSQRKALKPAYDKTFRVVSVGTSWVKVVSANPQRRYLLLQNRATSGLMEVRSGSGKDIGLTLDYLAAGDIAGSTCEMSEELGNLDTQAWYAKAAGAGKTLLVVESGSVPAAPAADISSSSSSSSSESSSSSSSSSSGP